MAGEWIKMRTNLWNDPRISQICDITSQAEAAVIGAMYWIWATADEHTQDGFMPGLSCASIDRKTGVQGFANALVTIGWLSANADGVTLERFHEHNGASAKSRAQTAKRVANHKSNAKVTACNEITNAHTVTSALPREEKRREEEINTLVPGVAEDQPSAPAKLDCPHKEIIALYHEVLPQCPAIRDWTPARATQLRARWNEHPDRQSLDYWRGLFEYVSGCDFLVGRSAKPFFADLEWITKSSNFTKIREGKYENR